MPSLRTDGTHSSNWPARCYPTSRTLAPAPHRTSGRTATASSHHQLHRRHSLTPSAVSSLSTLPPNRHLHCRRRSPSVTTHDDAASRSPQMLSPKPSTTMTWPTRSFRWTVTATRASHSLDQDWARIAPNWNDDRRCRCCGWPSYASSSLDLRTDDGDASVCQRRRPRCWNYSDDLEWLANGVTAVRCGSDPSRSSRWGWTVDGGIYGRRPTMRTRMLSYARPTDCAAKDGDHQTLAKSARRRSNSGRRYPLCRCSSG